MFGVKKACLLTFIPIIGCCRPTKYLPGVHLLHGHRGQQIRLGDDVDSVGFVPYQ